MNRRTFLQSVGAVAVFIISIPVLAKKEKTQWIKITDEFPKVGQEITVKGQFSFNRDQFELWFGKVEEINESSLWVKTYKNKEIRKKTTVREYRGECSVFFPTTENDMNICWRPNHE